MNTLNEREASVLDFERSWWLRCIGRSKADAIRADLGLSTSRYYALLRTLTDTPRARDFDPLLAARLHRRALQHRRAPYFSEPSRQGQH